MSTRLISAGLSKPTETQFIKAQPSAELLLLFMNPSAPFEYRALDAGLTETLVRKVVMSFYEKVRQDPELGPVFADAIGDGWDSHTERIIQFWLTATRLGRGYDGRNFMPVHLRNPSVRASLLPRWLELFRETTAEHCSVQAASVLVDIAERMAETLQIGLDRRDFER